MKKPNIKVGIADDIKRFHKKISTYTYALLAVAPQILTMLSPEVRDNLPIWMKASISILAVVGVSKNLVKVQKKDQ